MVTVGLLALTEVRSTEMLIRHQTTICLNDTIVRWENSVLSKKDTVIVGSFVSLAIAWYSLKLEG